MWASNLFSSVSHHFTCSSQPLVISLLSFISCFMRLASLVLLSFTPLHLWCRGTLWRRFRRERGEAPDALCKRCDAIGIVDVEFVERWEASNALWQIIQVSTIEDYEFLKRGEAPDGLCQIIQVRTLQELQMFERDEVSRPLMQCCHAFNIQT